MIQDNLFDTPEKIQSNLAILESGKRSAFWKLMCDILDANIEVVKDFILEGNKDDSSGFINLLRDRLKTYQNIRNTPEEMLKTYTSEVIEKPNLDPFTTVEDLKKARREAI
jgi:hypothetical protein